MGSFRVDPEALHGPVAEMEDFYGSLKGWMGQAESAMHRLSDSWDSEAASAGQDAYHQLEDGAERIREALSQLKEFLDGARQGYAAAILANRKMWGAS
ncbi:WXG100 family type VII secretion target [Mycobacterium sp. NPDC050853]|uniref:WXG100 family type VII secretion target n=1 Tax=Mycobacterium sp. NPDC050853 TaxID=3155160 RepID=UPI0033D4D1D3